MHKTGHCLGIAVVGLASAMTAHAAVVPITTVYTHNEKANFDGTVADMILGTGMNDNNYVLNQTPVNNNAPAGWPNTDPSTWTATFNGYQDEWQSGALIPSGLNNKIGWVVLDLGDPVAQLDKLYLWNVRETQARTVENYNVYYATSPTSAVTHGPTTGALDYDFASGGWTQVGSTFTMSWRGTDNAAVNDIVDLGGVNARYIAIEILTSGVGVTGDATRVGLAEVGITAVPEPAMLGLLGLGGLVVGRRRR